MLQIFLLIVGLAMFYDLMRIYRKLRKPSIIVIALLDIIFWSVAFWNVMEYLHDFGNGLLRWYHVLQAFAAIYLYAVYISDFFRKMVEFTIQKMHVLLTAIKRIVIIKGTRGGHQHGTKKKSSCKIL
ncbi:MAG: spore cortex biosynthesis protein YabQ [Lachnospiraceae bacterium]